jgi:hypothetical protein
MTKSNSSATLSTSNLYEHPWYSQLKLLDNTMTCESPLQPKLKLAVTGQKSTKQCSICGQNKELKDFPKHSHSKDNLDTRCRDCIRTASKLRAKLRKENPPPSLGPCPICSKITDKWVLDHCHITGTFRGYICDPCNLGLGKFKDDPTIVLKALNYLQTHGNQI